MSDYRRVYFDQSDPLFVTGMGYEDKGELAHWGPWTRPYWTVHFVTRGSGFFCGQPVHAGQGFLAAPGVTQEYHAATDDPWNYLWMIFSAELAERYVLPAFAVRPDGVFDHAVSARLLHERQRLFSTCAPLGHTEALSHFFRIVSLAGRRAEGPPSVPRQHYEEAVRFIRDNLSRRIGVHDAAAAVCIDDRYLYDLFVKFGGTSPKRYIDAARIEAATALLAETNGSITAVAAAVGFEDVCTFSKFFSHHTGRSPTAYRKSITPDQGTDR